jgi:hypothetical protein
VRRARSWLKLALPAAVVGILLYSSEQASTPRVPTMVEAHSSDPHDTLVADADTATPPLELPSPGAASSFSVRFKDEVSPHPVLAMFVMPGETVPLEVVLGDTPGRFSAEASAGEMKRLAPTRWSWTAPRRKGVVAVVLRDSSSSAAVTLNAFVLVPRPAGMTLGDFRIGRYESRPLRGDPSYARPKGMVEVTEANRGTFVAPHFTLGQFVSKQPGGYPKYLVLRERLLLKLEMLLEEAGRAGLPVTTFRIMSGYRTPYYNQTIGNETRYSRHLYGDAADIYVDEDGDGAMDDLDRDGRVDLDDAKVVAGLIERLSGSSWYRPFTGGLGLYRANPAHGPFLHVDVRGYPARWGP